MLNGVEQSLIAIMKHSSNKIVFSNVGLIRLIEAAHTRLYKIILIIEKIVVLR